MTQDIRDEQGAQRVGALSGSRPSGHAASGVDGGSRFDPARVRVTAADYNGQSWDGLPFNHVPAWLEGALRLGAITIVEDDRDYALWAVETPDGTKIAKPGDDIVCRDGHFDVHKDSYLASAMSGFAQDREAWLGPEGASAARSEAKGDAAHE